MYTLKITTKINQEKERQASNREKDFEDIAEVLIAYEQAVKDEKDKWKIAPEVLTLAKETGVEYTIDTDIYYTNIKILGETFAQDLIMKLNDNSRENIQNKN